jgi:hypothetical protein
MPNIPAEQQFCDAIHHPGYPCVEYGGIIWTYMGPAKELPALPEFEFALVPEDLRRHRLFRSEGNYLQVLEGGIDPTMSCGCTRPIIWPTMKWRKFIRVRNR